MNWVFSICGWGPQWQFAPLSFYCDWSTHQCITSLHMSWSINSQSNLESYHSSTVLSDEEAVIYLSRMVLIKDTFLGLNLVLSAEESNWSFSVYAFVIVLCCVVLCRIDSQGLILLRCVGQKLHVTFGLGAGELVCSAVFMMSNTEHMDLNSGTEDD